jgi:hypothetical protein
METGTGKESRRGIILMAKYRRSKTNTAFFMDIPKCGIDNKRFKPQESEDEKKGELPWQI